MEETDSIGQSMSEVGLNSSSSLVTVTDPEKEEAPMSRALVVARVAVLARVLLVLHQTLVLAALDRYPPLLALEPRPLLKLLVVIPVTAAEAEMGVGVEMVAAMGTLVMEMETAVGVEMAAGVETATETVVEVTMDPVEELLMALPILRQ